MCDDLCVGAVVQSLAVDLQDLVSHLQVRLVCRGPVQLDSLVVGLHEDDDVAAEVHHGVADQRRKREIKSGDATQRSVRTIESCPSLLIRGWTSTRTLRSRSRLG